MKKPIVWVLDDDEDQAKRWKDKLDAMRFGKRSTGAKGLNVTPVGMTELKSWMATLTERRSRARRSRGEVDHGGKFELDETDIFVIDYDLFNDKEQIPYTGEDLAYLVRCYSRCKVVVAINQYRKQRTFELDLTGHPESYADLNITGDDIDHPGLWSAEASPGRYRPWAWPVLPDLAKKMVERVRFVRERLGAPILESLGFDSNIVGMLPRSIEGFLGDRGKGTDVTFRGFAEGSGNGLKSKDKAGTGEEAEDRLARIAAARVGRWVEDMVLSAQEILIDAPHLATRRPSMLSEASKGTIRERLDKTARVGGKHDEVGMRADLLKKCEIESHWTSRPAWFWPKIVQVGEQATTPPPALQDLVFCEDTSCFAKRDKVKQFVAKVESAYVRRYVHGQCEGVQYHPNVRFAM